MLSSNLSKIVSRNALDTAGALQMGRESPENVPDASWTRPGARNKSLQQFLIIFEGLREAQKEPQVFKNEPGAV